MIKKTIESSMRLYAVTDRSWLKQGETLCDQLEKALQGGATFVQLREKELSEKEFLQQAVRVRKLTYRYGVPFVINDNVEIALKCGADGVHVGQEDMEAGLVRELLGPEKIIGVSAHSVSEAISAERAGADYLGVGAVFGTSTKGDAKPLSFETLREICEAVRIPVVAIGGISRSNIDKLKGSGIKGVAVVSAIFAAKDIVAATRELNIALEEVLG